MRMSGTEMAANILAYGECVSVCVRAGTEGIEGEEERKPERGTINRLLNIQPFTIQSSTLISSYTTHLYTVASR